MISGLLYIHLSLQMKITEFSWLSPEGVFWASLHKSEVDLMYDMYESGICSKCFSADISSDLRLSDMTSK